jgi:hypothetical protein
MGGEAGAERPPHPLFLKPSVLGSTLDFLREGYSIPAFACRVGVYP